MERFDSSKWITENKHGKALDELQLSQKVTGFFDKIIPWVKNLSPSADGEELKQDLKDKGISSTFTVYDTISDPGKKPDQSFTSLMKDSSTYGGLNTDPKMKVVVNQHQIDSATLDSSFRSTQAIFNFSDNIPKLKGKEFILNLKTGKYEPHKEGEEAIEPKGASEMDSRDMRNMEEALKDPISISIEDLKTRIEQNQ